MRLIRTARGGGRSDYEVGRAPGGTGGGKDGPSPRMTSLRWTAWRKVREVAV